MAERQQALASVILKDPDVASLSSFIGVDGTNPTLNSGRMQINLKPLEERRVERTRRSSAACKPSLAKVEGITLYMQPVQDLTVEDRVSRTQYQYTLEDADATSLTAWAPQAGRANCRRCRELRDVASDQQDQRARRRRWSSTAIRRRGSASRPQMIDDTLYDAFGQRQVSTMFTQLNQYHVVLEVDAGLPAEVPRRCKQIYVRSASGRQVPLSAFTQCERDDRRRWSINHQGQFPVVDAVVQSGARRFAGRGGQGDRAGRARDRLAGEHSGELPGNGAGIPNSLANEPLLILAALVTVYIVLGVLYESYIHPITILSTLPSAGVGALLALMICANRFQRHRA